MVHQHFMLVEPFTVLENLLLGAEGGFTLAERRRAGPDRGRGAWSATTGWRSISTRRSASLPVGVQQRVEILKALFRGARVLILDEPTGVLTPQEADHLFRILRNLKAQGRTIVLITHKLREIMAVTDQVSVMRAGAMVAHRKTAETSKEELAELMVGRKVLLRVEKGPARPREPVLEVRDLVVVGEQGVPRVKGISFEVRAGEILGIAGVAGNGQSELLDALAGIRQPLRGEILLRGAPITGGAQARQLRLRARARGPAAGRAGQGLHRLRERDPGLPDRAGLRRARLPQARQDRRRCAAAGCAATTCGRCEPRLDAHSFSGGNQQKLVLAREMEHDPDLLLVGQPTRGVDIGAIEFIHKRLIAMRDAGKAVLLVSVELDEILSLSDRILVMFDGTITGELMRRRGRRAADRLLMAGITQEAA